MPQPERPLRIRSLVAFVLGFAFDAWMLRRIDEPKVIVQQALYLVLCAALIGAELIETVRPIQVPGWLTRPWRYREPALHFMLGTLLNCYTIFYFKSASALTSFLFVALLVGLLLLNEFGRFGRSQSRIQVALLGLCLISYAAALSPILWNRIGLLPFLCAVLASLGAFWGYYRLLARRFVPPQPQLLRRQVTLPFGAMALVYTGLYAGGLIPPVPLSVVYMGIYHEVTKVPGVGYELAYSPASHWFWQHGDQTFLARPGDSVFCFAQIFSPTGFKEELQARWLYHDERHGWLPADAIPIPIVGGREEGYRAITRKSNYQPGRWRVQIETRDGREIGWIGLRIVRDESTEPRELARVIR